MHTRSHAPRGLLALLLLSCCVPETQGTDDPAVADQPRAARGRLYVIPRLPAEPAVVTLRIEARVTNWDADAASDGLELRLLPLGPSGNVVPVEGHLAVTLIGKRYRGPRGEGPYAVLGNWSQHVRAADFGPSGPIYRLPFQSVDPGRDRTFSSHGLVEAQLSTFRQGRLDAAVPARLRGDDPLGLERWSQERLHRRSR